jgi:hypothetical protein
MSRKVGINVALNLSTQKFSNSLNKAKGDMNKFSADIKRQNEVLGKLGMAGLGRGFGIAGGLAEGFAMGGVGGGVAAVAAPTAALAGTIMFFEKLNEFRRESVRAIEQFNKDMSAGKIGKLITDTQSGFVLQASRQQAVEGPGVFQTFMQSLSTMEGGQNLLLGARGAAGALGNLIGQILEDPTRLLPTKNTMAGEGLDLNQVSAAFNLGMAQNTAQAQVFDAQLQELKSIRAAMQGN